MGQRFETERISGLEVRPGHRRKPTMDCSDENTVCQDVELNRQSVKNAKEAWQQASGKEVSESTFRTFFISIGARYRRIRERPKRKTLLQLYAYKNEKLQELERQSKEGLIDLYFGDVNHICTERYVPYCWQFRGEDVFIPSQKGYRLNIFGMINRNNRYEGFSTNENITADKVVNSLDRLSFRIKKNTFVVLDNASIHRGKPFAEVRHIWEKRELLLGTVMSSKIKFFFLKKQC